MFNPEKQVELKTIIRRAEMADVPLILDLLSKNLAKKTIRDAERHLNNEKLK